MSRTILRRLLIASWMIPVMTLLGFPLWWLLGGWDDAVDTWRFTRRSLWHGDIT